MKILLLMSILLVALIGWVPEGNQSMAGSVAVKPPVHMPGPGIRPFKATPVAASSGRKEGGRLTPIKPLYDFQLQENSDYWSGKQLLINELKTKATVVNLPNVLKDSNHSGRRIDTLYPLSEYGTFHIGFHYDQEDEDSCWMPQGLTGSADAGSTSTSSDDKKVLAVSWHAENCGDRDKVGVRVSFIDVTDMDKIKYRHVLLVEPRRVNGKATFAAVNIHAGGIVWAGDYLYVADSSDNSPGLRVFDMKSIMGVDTTSAGHDTKIGVDGDKMFAYDYKYILPQIGRYDAIDGTSDDKKTMLFSWASLDRSSDPPLLLTGEYNDEDYVKNPRPSIDGRAFLWPLDKATNKLIVDPATKKVTASSAVYMNQHRVQGGFTHMVNGKRTYWFAGSHTPGYYKLYRKSEAKGLEETIGWPKGTPQNLTYSSGSDNLWGLSENKKNNRPVWAVKLSDID